MRLSNRTFFITGASSGLGRGTATAFAEAGANVILADVNEDGGKALERALGDRSRYFTVDVTDESSIDSALEGGLNTFGAIHGVINAAGIVLGRKTWGSRGPHDLASFTKVIQVNLIGTFNVIRLAAARMAINAPDEGGERGVIINTASVAAFDGQIGQAAYSASKSGVAGMTLPIARDLAKYGIRVMTIAPGIFETPMMAGMTDEVRQSLEAQVPFPSRMGRPSEYAALARHIIENTMLNGEVIRLDGAIRMAPR